MMRFCAKLVVSPNLTLIDRTTGNSQQTDATSRLLQLLRRAMVTAVEKRPSTGPDRASSTATVGIGPHLPSPRSAWPSPHRRHPVHGRDGVIGLDNLRIAGRRETCAPPSTGSPGNKARASRR